jgi:hypothetical protein
MLQATFEIMAFLPVLIMVGVFLIRPNNIELWVLSLIIYYLIGMLGRKLIKEREVYYYVLFGFIIVGSINLLVFEFNIFLVFRGILTYVLYYRGIKLEESSWEKFFPSHFYIISILIYGALYLPYELIDQVRGYLPILQVCGVCVLLISLLRVNYLELKKLLGQDQEKVKLPKTLMEHNMIQSIGVLILIFVIGSIKYIKSIFGWFINIIFQGIYYFLSFFSGAWIDREKDFEDGGMALGNIETYSRDSIFLDQLIEVFTSIVLLALMISFIVLLCYGTFKITKKVVDIISKFLIEKRKNTVDHDLYVDEKEMLIDFTRIRKRYINIVKSWLDNALIKEVKWSNLNTSKEKVRYLYRFWIYKKVKDGYEFKNNQTPKEIYEEIYREKKFNKNEKDLVNVYNGVRYGEVDISNEWVEIIQKELHNS